MKKKYDGDLKHFKKLKSKKWIMEKWVSKFRRPLSFPFQCFNNDCQGDFPTWWAFYNGCDFA